MLNTLRTAWRRLPLPYAVRARIGPFYGELLNAVAWARRTKPLAAAQIAPGPVIVSGYFSDVTGIGRAGRLTLDKVREWGVPVLAHDLRQDPAGRAVSGDIGPGGLWLCHCNAPQVLEALVNGTDRLWSTRYRIGYWAYELEELPQSWHAAISYFHEIWAPSAFVADAIERAKGSAPTLVRVVPHPLPDVAGATRNEALFGTAGVFTFLTMFDARSSFARKNPMGALKAFQAAFAPDDTRVALVIKVVGSLADRRSFKAVMDGTRGWPNIRIITDDLADGEALQLIASVDCLVSLHRSEGFGLTIAEAMAVGTPVIATNWSGNVEFSAGGVMAIPYELVPTVDISGRYAQRGARWAEPSIPAAAETMRQIFADEPMRIELIARAKRLVVERLGGPIPSEPYERFIARGQHAPKATELVAQVASQPEQF